MKQTAILRGLGFGAAALVAVILAVLAAANLEPGQRLLERWTERVSGGSVILAGLGGRLPDAIRAARIELRDERGPWLIAEDLELRWSPLQLAAGSWNIAKLAAGRVALLRTPQGGSGTGGPPLSFRAIVERLELGRLELAAEVAGSATVLAVAGSGRFDWPGSAVLDLGARRLDGEGDYRVQGRYGADGTDARLLLAESGGGPLAAAAGVPDLGPLRLEAELKGPPAALRITAELAGGPLRGSIGGLVDLERTTANLAVDLSAPAMAPAPELSWEALQLHGRCSGPLARPTVDARLSWDRPSAGGASAGRVALELKGDAGGLRLQGRVDGLRLPGSDPGPFAREPVEITADASPDQPGWPLRFSLRHPLLQVHGEGRAAPAWDGAAQVELPRLAPLAALAGLELAGSGSFRLGARQSGEEAELSLQGSLAVTGGSGPWPGLIGPKAEFAGTSKIEAGVVSITGFKLTGKALSLTADGTLGAPASDLQWRFGLTDLAPLGAGPGGRLDGHGRLRGRPGELTLEAELKGEAKPTGPVTARLELHGLPAAPQGRLDAQATLDGSPLRLALALQGSGDGQRLTVERAGWRSADIQGSLALPAGGGLPAGRLTLAMDRLQDLRGLTGMDLTGKLAGSLALGRDAATLNLTAERTGLEDRLTAGRAVLRLSFAEPLGRAALDGELVLDGLSAGEISGSGRVSVQGPATRPAIRLAANLASSGGDAIRAEAQALYDRRAQRLTLSALEAGWNQHTLQLAEPAALELARGVVLRRARLKANGAELRLSGRLHPGLDLALNGDKMPAAALLKPWIEAGGSVDLHARLQGDPSQPRGQLRLGAAKLRLLADPWRALPPAELALAADLDGAAARVDGRIGAAPQLQLAVTGRVPLAAAGELDLDASGSAELRLLNPLLAAAGERLRGRVELRGKATGSWDNPRLAGRLSVDGGEFHDDLVGVHIVAMTGSAQSGGGDAWNLTLTGRAGSGSVAVNGNLRPVEPGLPAELSITARQAEPIASDQMALTLDGDAALRGPLLRAPSAAGKLRIAHAEIRVPERLPASIAELRVEEPGAAPPPPAPPARPLGLDLEIAAPNRIFVRGRGLDVELGGTVRLRGNAANPRPQGRFSLIRGSYGLAGKTLNFSRGELSFSGGGLTDPVLDFTATSTGGGITATLTVTGSASKPKIRLSSSPELPSDEILAQLLFDRPVASLSPFELAQIAGSAAALTGIVPASGNPLERLRTSLGLDRLSVGSGNGGSPTLEGGRYVAPGVYVGTRQVINGSGGTQATVQVDVAKGLKLEGGIGTPTPPATGMGAGSVGVIYQFEY